MKEKGERGQKKKEVRKAKGSRTMYKMVWRAGRGRCETSGYYTGGEGKRVNNERAKEAEKDKKNRTWRRRYKAVQRHPPAVDPRVSIVHPAFRFG